MEPNGQNLTVAQFLRCHPLPSSPLARHTCNLLLSLAAPVRPSSLENASVAAPHATSSTRRYERPLPEELRPQLLEEEMGSVELEMDVSEELEAEEFVHWNQEEGGRKRRLELEEEEPRKKRALDVPRAGAEAPKGSRRTPRAKGKGPAVVLVPATPSSPARDLHLGSIQRCIPHPYCHTDIVPSHPPSKLHYCDLLHSYLDPPSTTASTAPRLASLVPATTAFPNALATLSPGRRGAFLIPLSQPLPYARSTPPSWEPATEKGTISWTDDRLRELWNLLDDLHKRGRMGDLFCEAVFEGETSPNLPLLARGTGDHLRLWVDAQLALPFRSFLRLLSVGWMRGEKEGDRVQFLRTAKLVWVNEQGRAAFLA